MEGLHPKRHRIIFTMNGVITRYYSLRKSKLFHQISFSLSLPTFQQFLLHAFIIFMAKLCLLRDLIFFLFFCFCSSISLSCRNYVSLRSAGNSQGCTNPSPRLGLAQTKLRKEIRVKVWFPGSLFTGAATPTQPTPLTLLLPTFRKLTTSPPWPTFLPASSIHL